MLVSSNICIGFIISSNNILIGIDPKYCFNKTSDCSILAHFPMSKREYKRFVKFFNKLNTDNNIKKNWQKIANICWFGSYIDFGR